MRWSRLGRSAVEITELSFGAAGIGLLYTPVGPGAAAAATDAAWDTGIRTFDTAPHHGLGLFERRLGEAPSTRPRDSYPLSTKVGRLLEPCPARGDDLAGGFAVRADPARGTHAVVPGSRCAYTP
jgi:D-threo-aldose 1-dehydrogenase